MLSPPGYNDIPQVTNSGDSINPGAGADIIYAGASDDMILYGTAAEWNIGTKIIDGGMSNDTLWLRYAGSADISDSNIINIESLSLGAGTVLSVKATAAQLSSFVTVYGLPGSVVTMSAAGSVNMTAAHEEVVVSEFDGSGGDDQINIAALAQGGTTINGEGGNDTIQFSYTGVKPSTQQFSLEGGTGDDTVTGTRGVFSIVGGDGSDNLNGGKLSDTLSGNAGSDTLNGGKGGHDQLSGGTGSDTFGFASKKDSPDGKADTITDFSHADGDRIDLSGVGKHMHLGGSSFSASKGEVIQTTSGGVTLLQADLNGDGVADFAIQLTGAPTLVSADFVF